MYYYSADGKVMVVGIPAGPQFQYDVPKPLFPVSLSIIPNASFVVSKDGRFLLPALVGQDAAAPMAVVLNWPNC